MGFSQPAIRWKQRVPFPGWSGRSVKLTHLLQKIRMRWAVRTFPCVSSCHDNFAFLFCSHVFFFLICFYCFQPVFYHPGIPQGIHGVLQWVFTVMFAVYMKSIVRFIFLGRHLGGLGRCVWGSLWCWRCLCEIAEPRVGGEIWGPPGGLLTISCILAAGGGPFVQSLLDSCSMEMSSCSSCVGMSGSYRGLLRTGWEGNWAIG